MNKNSILGFAFAFAGRGGGGGGGAAEPNKSYNRLPLPKIETNNYEHDQCLPWIELYHFNGYRDFLCSNWEQSRGVGLASVDVTALAGRQGTHSNQEAGSNQK